ncbi:hypothetical protein SB781_38090, partial [Paraburkholderia sp. SIMBA_061]
RGCRTNAIRPRYALFEFSNNTTSFIELPIIPTIQELTNLRQNSGALTVQLIGERIKYSKLQYILK